MISIVGHEKVGQGGTLPDLVHFSGGLVVRGAAVQGGTVQGAKSERAKVL